MADRFSGSGSTFYGHHIKAVWRDGKRYFLVDGHLMTAEEVAMLKTKPAPPVSREQTERFIQELYGD